MHNFISEITPDAMWRDIKPSKGRLEKMHVRVCEEWSRTRRPLSEAAERMRAILTQRRQEILRQFRRAGVEHICMGQGKNCKGLVIIVDGVVEGCSVALSFEPHEPVGS